jgi:hypothetical protein
MYTLRQEGTKFYLMEDGHALVAYNNRIKGEKALNRILALVEANKSK